MAKTKTKGRAKKTDTADKVSTRPINYSKPLKNSKYERFSQEYIKDSNGAQAAIRAEYSEKTANVKAAQLLTIVSISERVKYLQSELSKASGVDNFKVLKEFKKIAFGVVSKTLTNKHKISALEHIGKHIGFYEKHNKQTAGTLLEVFKKFIK
jgi:phage terminase small subunit